MADLFPSGSLESTNLGNASLTTGFKGSYAINFDTMEFIKNPDGTIKILDAYETYIQWCQLAMMTARYRYRAYTSKFGRDIIGKMIDQKAMELEIKRVTTETLMVHPMTASIDNFVFIWENGEVYYTYEVTATSGQSKVLSNSEKVG
ncbi:DUF2634 domain-containing protein [Clostridium beijerinckii]|jgi:Protein of unknown function (DUF2634).|uniref:DUF2634 domain-containing protein n=2 Tax=Clostridium beijerinckii TaxID=1520 RepID=A0A1S8QP28_CLOBE|nr:DUF2634 domain-containing protein [Clostridium beijerinckii]ABR33829.1 hypothetical protein Cbei_1655 [Clostridium beijerinckii NCIMB 8052]AIU01355.1 hypothetical protein Cbs_1655 [Clostridium beijerinckii ATCC 35702]MBF7812255.1 DUF2634 domain-containing protein [Clostridium beijerinckii]NRT24884.1 hypothetical protein [Clostridium beijerinckii]NRT34049.1 hypothetical protein [Clostridium beijerinckii]